MKIRPKPRNYSKDDLDESYFAARSTGDDGACSRDEENDRCPDSGYADVEKREFKILDKKLEKMKFASNEISTTKYTKGNFISLALLEQLSKPLNSYFVVMMLIQMMPGLSLSDG